MIALCFNEWMKMLTFGFPFCNFDLKMWNFALKIIMSLLISALTQTRKTGQLDTPEVGKVMFLLHGCKNHMLEFLLSVSSTNNIPLVNFCAKS